MRNFKEKFCFMIICVALAAILFSIAYSCGNQSKSLPYDNNATIWDGERTGEYVANTSNQIAIPGWENINLKADSVHQSVNFRNPSSNSCLFSMTLYVEDEAVWSTGYVKPGYGFYEIELAKSFHAGERDGKLHIQCYDVDGTELNSATVNFRITFR